MFTPSPAAAARSSTTRQAAHECTQELSLGQAIHTHETTSLSRQAVTRPHRLGEIRHTQQPFPRGINGKQYIAWPLDRSYGYA
jgi:hypothetical protein